MRRPFPIRARPRPGLGWLLGCLLASPAAAAGQTAVSVAQPSVLRLTAGGATAELAIQGTALDLVRGIEVTSSGRVVTYVSVRTVKGGASDLTLALQASATAAGGKGLRVVLVTDRDRLEVPVDVTLEAAAAAPRLMALDAPRASMLNAQSGVVTVRLDQPAPEQGVVVQLTTDRRDLLSVPASVSIPGGRSEGSAPISVVAEPAAASGVTVTAELDGVRQSGVVQVEASPAPQVTGIQISADPLDALQSAVVTVTLDRAAPAAGQAVSLSSSTPSALVLPAELTVSGGAASASLNVTAGNPAQDATTTLTATAGGAPTPSRSPCVRRNHPLLLPSRRDRSRSPFRPAPSR